jgi:hypothetical protein
MGGTFVQCVTRSVLLTPRRNEDRVDGGGVHALFFSDDCCRIKIASTSRRLKSELSSEERFTTTIRTRGVGGVVEDTRRHWFKKSEESSTSRSKKSISTNKISKGKGNVCKLLPPLSVALVGGDNKRVR